MHVDSQEKISNTMQEVEYEKSLSSLLIVQDYDNVSPPKKKGIDNYIFVVNLEIKQQLLEEVKIIF